MDLMGVLISERYDVQLSNNIDSKSSTPIELHVSRQGYRHITAEFDKLFMTSLFEGGTESHHKGHIKIVGINGDSDININEGKVLYADGTIKTITIFNI